MRAAVAMRSGWVWANARLSYGTASYEFVPVAVGLCSRASNGIVRGGMMSMRPFKGECVSNAPSPLRRRRSRIARWSPLPRKLSETNRNVAMPSLPRLDLRPDHGRFRDLERPLTPSRAEFESGHRFPDGLLFRDRIGRPSAPAFGETPGARLRLS